MYWDINIIWMNLIMTSRRDVTGMMVNGFGGIIPKRPYDNSYFQVHELS